MFSRIFLDICLQFWRVQDLDIIGQPAVEPTNPGKVIYSGLQYPVGSFPGDILGGKRIFLQQKVLCSQAEAQPDLLRGFSGHPEHVGALAAVAAFEFPIFIKNFNFADTRNLEDFVVKVAQVISPDIDEVCRKGEWLNQSVLHGFATGRFGFCGGLFNYM